MGHLGRVCLALHQYCISTLLRWKVLANSLQLAQAGIAMLSLTYSWDPATDGVIMRSGNVTIPKLDYFYPLSDDKPGNITAQDEAYTAHLLVIFSALSFLY
jgi:hypothetical protein